MRCFVTTVRSLIIAVAVLALPFAAAEQPVITVHVDTFEIEGGIRLVQEGAAVVPVEIQELPDVEIDRQAEDVLEGEPAVRAPAGGFLGLGLRAMFNAIAPAQPQVQELPPVDGAADGEMPKDPRQAQLWQQRKQIRQQAAQMQQIFQPLLRTELEMIRQACPDLPVEARRRVLAAGNAAVTKTALDVATRQMLGGQPRRAFDARRSIQEPLRTALEPDASAAELAAYEREQHDRLDRRAAAARVAIVAKLDRRLELTSAQRRTIEEDLTQRWDDAWLRELDDNGVVINNERIAPDYANACIEPHLDGQQNEEWQRWRRAAGVAVVGMHVGWNIDGQGLHQEDDWWTQ